MIDELIAAAESQLGIVETSRNQGPGIAKYWTATDYPEGYKNREPWCAAFVCWVLSSSFPDGKKPRTAVAFGFEKWGARVGLKVEKPARSVKRGDIVVFGFSHVGIALSDSDAKGTFQTIEGNTNAQGAREGNGVWRKKRKMSEVRSVVRLLLFPN